MVRLRVRLPGRKIPRSTSQGKGLEVRRHQTRRHRRLRAESQRHEHRRTHRLLLLPLEVARELRQDPDSPSPVRKRLTRACTPIAPRMSLLGCTSSPL
jgi:hypothetical protein